jgi:hypothetical protein
MTTQDTHWLPRRLAQVNAVCVRVHSSSEIGDYPQTVILIGCM